MLFFSSGTIPFIRGCFSKRLSIFNILLDFRSFVKIFGLACNSWNEQKLQNEGASAQEPASVQFVPKRLSDIHLLQMWKAWDGRVEQPPATPRLYPDARPQWLPRPASAGDERNRFTGAAAELHGGSGILAANKASVRRNLGPSIGTPGGC